MMVHTHAPRSSLTRNQSLVMAALDAADEPMGAYMILDKLRDEGLRAPPQIYRALDRLLDLGMVHRIESLNAFVACRRPDCEKNYQSTVFAICDKCRTVSEVDGGTLAPNLRGVSEKAKFHFRNAVVELRGLCSDCEQTGDASRAPSAGCNDKQS